MDRLQQDKNAREGIQKQRKHVVGANTPEDTRTRQRDIRTALGNDSRQQKHPKGTEIRKSVSVWVVAEQVYQSDQIATGIPFPTITYEINKGEIS